MAAQLLAPLQEIEFQYEPEPGHFPFEGFHQLRDGPGGSTGGKHVVDDQDILARTNCVFVDLWDPLESTCRHASLSIL